MAVPPMDLDTMERCARTNTITCLYCPMSMADNMEDYRKMPPNLIGYHIAACHLELPSDPNSEPYKYSCDGNAIDADMACCRLDQVYETLAVNDYVEHMKKHHPAQEISFRNQYKAALVEFMAEVSIFDSEQPASLRSREYRRHLCDYVKWERNDLPAEPLESTDGADSDRELLEQNVTAIDDDSTANTQEQGTAKDRQSRAEEVMDVATDQAGPANVGAEETIDSFNNDFSSDRSTPANASSVDHDSAGTSVTLQRKRTAIGSPRNRIFTSPRGKEMLQRLSLRYGKAVSAAQGGAKVYAQCAKCSRSIVYKSTGDNTAIQHAMSHLERPVVICKICGSGFRSYSAWWWHLRYRHPRQMARCATLGSNADVCLDRRKEMEEDIVQVTTECFLY